MRRIAALLALTVGASLLAGCVYDPYTGTWQPCCNYYGYPYGYPVLSVSAAVPIRTAIRPGLICRRKVSRAPPARSAGLHIRASRRSRRLAPGASNNPAARHAAWWRRTSVRSTSIATATSQRLKCTPSPPSGAMSLVR